MAGMKCKEANCTETVVYVREDIPVTDNVAGSDSIEQGATAALTCANGHTHMYEV